MRLGLLSCLTAALALLIPTASADGTEIGFETPVEIYDNLPPLPPIEVPIDTPDFIQCAGAIAQVCVIIQPEPCAGLKPQANLHIYRDVTALDVYVEVGLGGPGGYGGYSEQC